jgi:outer membrane protein TolC
MPIIRADMQGRYFRLIKLISATSLWLTGLACYAQTPLELPQAVAIALEKNPARKMALADTQLAHAQVSMTQSGFFPRVSFAETATIGNDSVYAFGTRLRQGRFTQADFALNNLNNPEPLGNFSSRVSGQWNLFDSFAKNYQVRSAKLMEQSSTKQLGHADQQIIFSVIDSYYAIGVTRKQVEVAEQLVKTAQAVLDSSNARVEAGSAVESDALSARVNLASRQQDLIRAKSDLQLALTRFETALGAPLTPGQQPAAMLKEQSISAASLEETEARALKQRPDLLAMASQVEAQQNGVKAAKAAYGPRLDVFGSWQADNLSMFSGGSNNWITGAELRIDLFSRDREARLSAEKASLSQTQAAKQMAENNIRLDVRKAWLDHDASRQMLDVSRASVQQAEDSLRMVRDRYESGLATITDLLRAEDADRTSRINYWQSVYRYIVSYAAVELAAGELTSQSPVVTQ